MKFLKAGSVIFLISLITACGGGGYGSSKSAALTNYNFVIPPLNSQRVYGSTIIDNSSNTINLSFTETVTAINSNGTYTVLMQDPGNNSITVNGTTYSTPTETLTVNNSDQVLSFVNNTAQINCSYSPYGEGPTFPIAVGYGWSSNFSETCGSNAPIHFTQSGTVIDLESVSVPAGTFNALKMQLTVIHTDPMGTIHNQAYITWRDVNTGIAVKRQITTTYSGTPLTNGYPVTNTTVLESGTP